MRPLLLIDAAIHLDHGPEIIVLAETVKPGAIGCRLRSHAAPNNRHEAPTVRQQLEGLLNMIGSCHGLFPPLQRGLREGRIHNDDGGRRVQLAMQEAMQKARILRGDVGIALLTQRFDPSRRNLIDMHLVTHDESRHAGERPRARAGLLHHIGGLEVGDPGRRIGIVERRGELL